MSARIIEVKPDQPRESYDLDEAVEKLLSGGLVAFPTETVYGLGAVALDVDAVAQIFETKGRPATRPVIVHVSSVEQAREVTREWPESASRLAERFWPGPLTLILPRADVVPANVSAGLDTVGVRMPAHPVALELIERVGKPLAAPSANRYTAVSPTTAQHVARSLGDAVELILDAGPTDVGLESTVVSLVGAVKILRPGMITHAEIKAVVGELEDLHGLVVDEGDAASSPGQARRHYAPEGQLVIASPETRAIFNSKRVGLIRLEGGPLVTDAFVVDLPAQPEAYARRLYESLHACDEAGCEYIVVEPPPRNDAWAAIWDRLRRAAEAS